MSSDKTPAAHLRLAGVLERRSWCEWCPWVRNDIANPFWALVPSGEVCVTGDEPLMALGRVVGRQRQLRHLFRTKIPSLMH